MIAVQNSHIHFITNPFYRKSLSQKIIKEKAANPHSLRICGFSTKYRGYWIRTSGLYVPKSSRKQKYWFEKSQKCSNSKGSRDIAFTSIFLRLFC